MKTLTILALLSLGSCGRVAFAQERPSHALAWSIAAMSAGTAAAHNARLGK